MGDQTDLTERVQNRRKRRLKERTNTLTSKGANLMTTATYRGVQYNVEDRKLNVLQMIKDQIEKEQRRKAAQLASLK